MRKLIAMVPTAGKKPEEILAEVQRIYGEKSAVTVPEAGTPTLPQV